MYPEVAAALIKCKQIPAAYNYIFGLGGKDTKVSGFEGVFEDVIEGKAKTVNYLGVNE
jgi:hypothetical protein